MTHVRGLERFGIDPSALAKSSKKHFACAAALAELPGANAQGRVELAVQGHVVEKLAAMLVARGVPRRCIDVRKGKGAAGGKKPKSGCNPEGDDGFLWIHRVQWRQALIGLKAE